MHTTTTSDNNNNIINYWLIDNTYLDLKYTQQLPLQNITNNAFFANGGVFITIAINIALLVIFSFIYIICLRPCTLFNVKKKKKLVLQCLKRESIEAKEGRERMFKKRNQQEERNDNQSDNQLQDKEEEEEGTPSVNNNKVNHEENHAKSKDVYVPEATQSKTAPKFVEEEIDQEEKEMINHSCVEVQDIKPVTRFKIKKLNDIASYFKFKFIFLWRVTISLFKYPYLVFSTIFYLRPNTIERENEKTEDLIIIKYYGRDMLTYIKFHQLLVWVVLFLTILYSVVLYPVHISQKANLKETLNDEPISSQGHSTGLTVGESDQFILYTSINTIINMPWFLVIHVILSIVLFISFVAMLLLFMFDPKLRKFNFADCDRDGKWVGFSPYISSYWAVVSFLQVYNMSLPSLSYNRSIALNISPFTIEINHIPKKFTNKKEFQLFIKKLFKKNNNENNEDDTESRIVNCSHTFDLSGRDKLQKKFEKLNDEFDQLKYEYQKTGKRPTYNIYCKKDKNGNFKFKQTIDLIESKFNEIKKAWKEMREFDSKFSHLIHDRNLIGRNQEMFTMESSLDDEKIELSGSGVGYIVFKSTKDLKQIVNPNNPFKTLLVYKAKRLNDTVTLLTSEEYKQMKREKTLNFKSIKKRILRINPLTVEPNDMNWDSIYTYNKTSVFLPYVRKFFLYLLIIIIFVFFTTPVVVVSSIQFLLALPPVRDVTNEFIRIGGSLAGLFFQYLPSLLLLIISGLIPIFVYYITLFDKLNNYSEFKRLYLKRATIFLWLNALIFPTLILTSIDGIINFFTNQNNWRDTFSKLFLPSSGTLFINYILNKTVWGVIIYFLQIISLIYYCFGTRRTSWFWLRFTNFGRLMLPKTKLLYAESPSFFLESQYALSFTVLAIIICFSGFSPFILLCGSIYFLVKYYSDRICIAHTYSHRMIQQSIIKKYESNYIKDYDNVLVDQPYGCIFSNKSDYVGHRKYIRTLVDLTLGCLLIFHLYLTLFFATKIVQSNLFIGHVVVESILSALVLALYFLNKFYFRYERYLLGKEMKSKLIENSDILKKAYTPTFYWNYKNQIYRDRYKYIKRDPILHVQSED
ncbi:hypothetical protein ABK040_009125 [Willaertia magna]